MFALLHRCPIPSSPVKNNYNGISCCKQVYLAFLPFLSLKRDFPRPYIKSGGGKSPCALFTPNFVPYLSAPIGEAENRLVLSSTPMLRRYDLEHWYKDYEPETSLTAGYKRYGTCSSLSAPSACSSSDRRNSDRNPSHTFYIKSVVAVPLVSNSISA